MSPARMAIVRLVVGAVVISFAPVFVRAMDTPPTAAAFWRCAVGGGALVFIAALQRGRQKLARRTLVFGVLAGLFFALDLAVWHRAIHLIGPGLATLLVNFQVFVLALFGVVFLRERPHPRVLTAIPIAVVGLALIVGVSPGSLSENARLGIGLALATSLVYAGYILSLKRARSDDTSPVLDVGVASVAGAVFLAPIAFVLDEPLGVMNAREGGLLLAYALVPQVIGWVLISSSLAHVTAARVGLILLLQPTLAFVWDISLFDRPFTPREGLGAALALLAVGIGSTAQPRTPPPPRE